MAVGVLQTDLGGAGEAELRVSAENELGSGDVFGGVLAPGRWHRLAVSVQSAKGYGGVGQVHKFIDGRFVGAYLTDSPGEVSRWTLGDSLLLFTDSEPVSTEGSWEAGVDGAQPGIVMLADPQVGDVYRQEYAACVAEEGAGLRIDSVKRVIANDKPVDG